MIPPVSALRLGWLFLRAGQPAVGRVLRGDGSLPPARWPNAPAAGKKLLKRRFQFAGCDVEMAGRIVWQSEEANEAWHRELYGFRWLQDIAATQSYKIASSFAREFINGFIVEPQALPPLADAPDVMGIRLAEWLYHRHFILKGGSQRFQRRFVREVARHIWQLYRQIDAVQGDEAIAVMKGLISTALFLPSLKLPVVPLVQRLETALDEVVLADGGHVSRNPETHLHILQQLIEIRDLLYQTDLDPADLDKRIEAMGSMLRFFCHGDGRLALFNGALMEEPHRVARTIERSDNGEAVPAHMDVSGFFRLERGHSCVLLCGQPQRPDTHPTPSLGSFEFSEGVERFVVNCGGYRGTSKMWQSAALTSAAHSTLSLQPVERPATAGHAALWTEEAPAFKPDRFFNDGSFLLARTSRLEAAAGIEGLHERELRLNASGQQLSGMDIFRLLRVEGSSPSALLTLRFHLHPDIRCQKQKDGTISLSSVSGITWYFTSTMPKSTTIEESVYLGYYGKPQKTLQLVITSEFTTKVTELRWSLTRQVEN